MEVGALKNAPFVASAFIEAKSLRLPTTLPVFTALKAVHVPLAMLLAIRAAGAVAVLNADADIFCSVVEPFASKFVLLYETLLAIT